MTFQKRPRKSNIGNERIEIVEQYAHFGTLKLQQETLPFELTEGGL